ncbi:YopX family protein [Streptococcus dysgalactiae subsp. equisimilis]|uniref:YopX family protein n=1 Tax=Streptococcus dysgalactiae TaxID=1334 RepID=UPI0023DE117E|nr:YopX family protein [Streptococcus dysgalactiae]WEQ79916.1 YopX family protein [Streptococcus dysgalactiae subsp. equisimilis]
MIPKFRVWDKVTRAMGVVEAIDYVDNKIYTFYRKVVRRYIPFEEAVLMQSTGLKDKNGVEIFDGDVVNFMVPNQMISGTYQIRQAKSGEWRLDNRVQGRPLYISGSYHCEVVGNVWEDGDLLESVEG